MSRNGHYISGTRWETASELKKNIVIQIIKERWSMVLDLHDRVLVEPLSAEENRRHHHPRYSTREAAGGQNRCRRNGARGDDGKVQALDVKKGDKVLYGKWSGTEVKVDGKDLLIMKESDIMGITE